MSNLLRRSMEGYSGVRSRKVRSCDGGCSRVRIYKVRRGRVCSIKVRTVW